MENRIPVSLKDNVADIGEAFLADKHYDGELKKVRIYKLSDIYGENLNYYKVSQGLVNIVFCDRKNPLVEQNMKVIEHDYIILPNNGGNEGALEVSPKSQIKLITDSILYNQKNINEIRNHGVLIATLDYDLSTTIRKLTPLEPSPTKQFYNDFIDMDKIHLITSINYQEEYEEYIDENKDYYQKRNRYVEINLIPITDIKTSSGHLISMTYITDILSGFGSGMSYGFTLKDFYDPKGKVGNIPQYGHFEYWDLHTIFDIDHLERENSIALNSVLMKYQPVGAYGAFSDYRWIPKFTKNVSYNEYAKFSPQIENGKSKLAELLYPFLVNNKVKWLSLWRYAPLSGSQELVNAFIDETEPKDVKEFLNLGGRAGDTTINFDSNTIWSITLKAGMQVYVKDFVKYYLTQDDIVMGIDNRRNFIKYMSQYDNLYSDEYISWQTAVPDVKEVRAFVSSFTSPVSIQLKGYPSTTLYALLLEILSDTYNISRNFEGVEYTEQGNPKNEIAKLKDRIGNRTAIEYLNNKIKQWELENPALIENDIYKINFQSILCWLSRYIDCDYVISGGNLTEVHTWVLGYYAELISKPTQVEPFYFKYNNCQIKLYKTKVKEAVKENEFLTPPNVLAGKDTVAFPFIEEIINEKMISLYPKNISNENASYSQYFIYGNINDEIRQRKDLPIFETKDLGSLSSWVEAPRNPFNKIEDNKGCSNIQNIEVNGFGFGNLTYLKFIYNSGNGTNFIFNSSTVEDKTRVQVHCKLETKDKVIDETLTRFNISFG